jgi:hypothetical protein
MKYIPCSPSKMKQSVIIYRILNSFCLLNTVLTGPITHGLHFHGRRVSQARNRHKTAASRCRRCSPETSVGFHRTTRSSNLVRCKIFVFSTSYWPVLGPAQPHNGYRGFYARGREADHGSPTSAEVKDAWFYTSTPPYVFMVYCSRTNLHGVVS